MKSPRLAIPRRPAPVSPIIHLRRLLKLPPCTGYIDAEVPGGTTLLRQRAFDYYRDLEAHAREAAQQQGASPDGRTG